MQNFQDIEHFVKTLSAAIKKKIPTKVSQLTNDAGYKTTDTNTTYKLSKSGSTVTLTGSDGSTTSVTDSNTTYSSLKNPYSLTIQNNGTTVASYDGSTAKTANFTNATASANGLMSAADKKAIDREFFRMLPKGGTYIPANADLNSIEYIKVGNYYNSADAESKTIKNIPVNRAFIMYVLSPLSEVYDNESTAQWVYRLRIFVTYVGNIYTQLVSSGNTKGVFTYGSWSKLATNKSDVGLGNVDNTADSAKSVKYATSADTVDGLHEYSFLRYRDATSTNGAETLWNQIGIKEYDNALPSGLSGLYNYGAVVSLPSNNIRFDLYYNHHSSDNGNGLYYRTGWGTDKRRWVHLIDSQSIGSQSVNYANSAGSVAWGNVSGRPSSLPANGGNSATVNGHTVNADVPSGAKFTDTTYGAATQSANGLMSAADKKKLDGVSSGADVSPIKTVKVNGTALTPDSNKAVNVTVPTLANNATTTTSGMALDARMGKTLSDQISSLKAGVIDQIVNLTAAGWTGDTAPYSQTVNVTGMTDELLCELFSACPKSATVAEREAYNEAFALVASGYAETADGSATFLVDEKPEIDIGVRIKSISKANAVSDQTSSDIISAVDAMSNTLWGKIYPVGSIYISANSTSPANLFGGTWEQLKDVFLLAAGDTYKAGSTGGEAQHKLTVDEMPSHTHAWKGKNTGAFSSTGITHRFPIEGADQWDPPMLPTGGSQPHNNMPPYITVYMWKRTA